MLGFCPGSAPSLATRSHRWARAWLTLFALAAGTQTALAQTSSGNFKNGDFEASWSETAPGVWPVPPEWWIFPALVVPATHSVQKVVRASPPDPSALVYSGGTACRYDSGGETFAELGKKWSDPATQKHLGKKLRVVFRAKFSSLAMAQRVDFRVYNLHQGIAEVSAMPAHDATTRPFWDEWQEYELTLTPGETAGVTAYTEIRATARFRKFVTISPPAAPLVPGDHMLLDFVTFGDSEPEYSADGATVADRELHGSDLSLLIDGPTGRPEQLAARPQQGTGVGMSENLLASSLASEMYHILTTTTVPPQVTPTEPVMTSVTDGTSTTVTLTETKLGRPFDASIEVNADHTLPGIRFDLAVDDPGGNVVFKELTYPAMVMRETLGASKTDDRILYSSGDGGEVRTDKVTSTSNPVNYRGWDYPGIASMQLLAFYDDTVGVGVMAKDPTGEAKRLLVRHQFDQHTRLDIVHRTPEQGGLAIARYPVELFACSGSWTAAAEHYRDWALLQPWTEPLTGPTGAPVAVRPSWIWERPTLLEADVHPMLNGVFTGRLDPVAPPPPAGQPLYNFTNLLNRWQDATGSTMLPLFLAFERNGVFATGPLPTMLPFGIVDPTQPEVTPLSGSYPQLHTNDLPAVWQEARDWSHEPMAMMAVLKWAISRTAVPLGPPVVSGGPGVPKAPGAPHNSVCDPTKTVTAFWVPAIEANTTCWQGTCGHPSPFDVCARAQGDNQPSEYETPAVWDSRHYWFCPGDKAHVGGTSYTKQNVVAYCVAMVNRGVRLLEFDQMNGGGTKVCYHAGHDHPPGYGRWMYSKVAEMLDEAINTVSALSDGDAALSMEDPGELFIPYIAVFTGRTSRVFTHPALFHESTQIVPAFRFVYGSIVPSLSPDLTVSTPNQPGLPTRQSTRQQSTIRLARAFVNGGWMGARVPNSMLNADFGTANTRSCAAVLPSSHDLQQYPERVEPQQLQLLKNAIKVGQGVAKPFFNGAKMVGTSGATYAVPATFAVSYTLSVPGAGTVVVNATHDKVIYTAWQLGGSKALAVVNAWHDPSPAQNPPLPTHIDGEDVMTKTVQYSINNIPQGSGVYGQVVQPAAGLQLAPGDVWFFQF